MVVAGVAVMRAGETEAGVDVGIGAPSGTGALGTAVSYGKGSWRRLKGPWRHPADWGWGWRSGVQGWGSLLGWGSWWGPGEGVGQAAARVECCTRYGLERSAKMHLCS